MFSKRILGAAMALPAAVLIGCASNNGSSSSASAPQAAAAPAPAATQPAVPIPPDSPFAKVKTGMSMEQVSATIGPPSSQRAYATGKAWIPFHYGGDNSRVTAYYKGIGEIVYSQDSAFSSGYSVMEVDYDPTDPGFPR
jgi:hypothetical protein